MTITEKIAHDNPCEIRLYKEGVFWIAYEQSAYYILQRKGYKATKKMIKMLGKEVVSVGFPQSSYEILKTATELIPEKDEPHFKIFSLDKPIDMDAFIEWKAGLPPARERQSSPTVKPETANGADIPDLFIPGKPEEESPSGKDVIFQKLRDFPLEDKTPMECMMFLSELKKIFYTHGNLRQFTGLQANV